jgi:predicted ferric reductase
LTLKNAVLIGISHMVLAHDWRGLFFVILVILVLLHSFASPFSSPPLVFLSAREVFRRHCWLQSSFSSGGEDTASVVAVVFM